MLKSLPDGIGQLTGLINLVLSNNALVSLPETIGTLTTLKVRPPPTQVKTVS